VREGNSACAARRRTSDVAHRTSDVARRTSHVGETHTTSGTDAKFAMTVLPPKLHLKAELGVNPEP
jgi:hypothetical protein